jgi:hypothetical protein
VGAEVIERILAIFGAIWVGCMAVLFVMWLAHRAGQQWEQHAFHRTVNDDQSVHEWLESGQ